MKYTLRQLEVFLATARAETLSQAAQELAMSQSAASDALAGLEQQFDVRLFDRIGKRLQLNETGRSLLPAVEELLVRARELERVLGRKDTAGALAVGATLSIGNYLAVPIMLRYMQENPGARVTLDVANTAAIAQKIARFELDVGLIEGEIRHPDLELAPWRDDELVVFCAPQHPLAKRRRLGERELLAAHVDPARAGLRHAPGLRPRHARPAGAARTCCWNCSTPRPSSAPSRAASASAACRARRCRRPSSAAAWCRLPCRAGISRASSTSCCTGASTAAQAYGDGSSCAAQSHRSG
jgi:DNA-binding transcriptional LysR family regulator